MLGLLLRLGFMAAIGVVTGIFVYKSIEGSQQQQRPHEYRRGEGGSYFQEPHDPWGGPSSSSSGDRSRSGSTSSRRRRRARRGDTCSQKEMMTDDLCAGLCECIICVEFIDAREEVYSCKKCYNIFHLQCIRNWAKSCFSDQGTHWTCPVCKVGSTVTPDRLIYTCMCGQTVKPASRAGATPHCCARNCSRCKLPCHPGACD